MSEVTVTESFAVPAARLWELVSDFGGIADIMDGVDECAMEGEGVGATRTIPAGPSEVVESLDVLDHDNHVLTYSIVSGPLPFKDYSATMDISSEGDDACSMAWTGTFEADGVPVEKAEKLANGIYSGGMAGYRKALGL